MEEARDVAIKVDTLIKYIDYTIEAQTDYESLWDLPEKDYLKITRLLMM